MPKVWTRILIACVGIVIVSEGKADISAEELVVKIRPSIVGITVAPSLASGSHDNSLKDVPTSATTINLKGYSVGSGTIISSNGLILTDISVLSPLGEITVTLEDGSKNIAKVVGQDTETGFALIKIPRASLPSIKVLNPQKVALGQNLIAFGRTTLGSISIPVVTNGIVSGIAEINNSYGAIQSTIPVQPGMGGAAVISLKTGEVIGIIQMIYRGEKFSPITFSTPIEEYLKIENSLYKNSK